MSTQDSLGRAAELLREINARRPVPSEDELAARIALLDAVTARWVLYRLATGNDAVRADLAACLDRVFAAKDTHPEMIP